jgi:hypothetical protein
MDHKYTKPLVSWPTGLGILISNTPYNDLQRLIDLLWIQAVRYGSPNSMQLLLQSDVTSSIDSWINLHNNSVFVLYELQLRIEREEYKEQKEIFRDVLLTMARNYLQDSSSDKRFVLAIRHGNRNSHLLVSITLKISALCQQSVCGTLGIAVSILYRHSRALGSRLHYGALRPKTLIRGRRSGP